LENQIEQMETFQEMISGDYDYVPPRRGQVKEVVILSISEHAMVVDLGTKRDGVVLESDLSTVDESYRESLQVGDTIPVAVTRLWDGDEITVSLKLGLQQQDWLRAERLVESGDVVTGEVVDTNRGGVLVSFGPLTGFVPNSHLGGPFRSSTPEQLDETKAGLVGQVWPLVVIEVDQARRRLVFSRRLAERRQRQKLIEELAPEQVRTGVVRSIVPFGAFVDLGGIDGLVHISELDWQYIEHPSDAVHVGDEIQVYVISVDRERQRIGLSRKRLLPDPWEEVSTRLKVDDVIQGTVTAVKPFGIFVDIGQGVQGLVRRSASSGTNALLDTESLSGSEVTVQVLDIDHAKHQIELEYIDYMVVAEPEPAWVEEAYSSTSLALADVPAEAQ
jgi:small subunit ribosomal protein S1